MTGCAWTGVRSPRGRCRSVTGWWERKAQPPKPHLREENNEPLILSAKVQSWMSGVLAPLPLCTTDQITALLITSKLIRNNPMIQTSLEKMQTYPIFP